MTKDYKYVYIRCRAYEQLRKRQLPNEDISQTIERLLTRMDEIYGHAEAISEVVKAERSSK